ncbi:hypothetical protein BMS3Abin07_02273 [bacterium BMS3Abin07]|nr:hypothetical protein BMS3Abin07_02273 [bacterium BMS3Abin07]GBE32517.1 hypothetical protein BMS3Bbin05_01432 [bacterium BMS3Bbin05]HDL19837.1 hypothetical protein [Nitrospirota bacterium]HDO23420.1 hypothetical protein [Nitrospirota bacterium]HDZ87820.1 hypothetical protein [Nitrospirota bacterium]
MEAYRYQQIAYLIVPIMLGMEFFMTARFEKSGREETPFGSYVLDFFGFLFAGFLPAVFIFTIWALEAKKFIFGWDTLARLDRYAVMFFFFGAWWQIYMLTALRARRCRGLKLSGWYVWLPYIGLGIFVSLLILWVSPWNLKWVSVFWFLLIFALLKIFKVSMRITEKIFWVLTVLTFLMENLMFIWLESVI